MSDLVEREVYVVPHVGTVVSLENPGEVARALSDVRDMEANLRDAKRILTDALVEESKRQGTKTLELGSVKAEIRGGSEIVWDTEKLETALHKLACPPSLIEEIIKTEITYKVDARRASRAATANPEYAEAIASARVEIEKPYSIVIRKP